MPTPRLNWVLFILFLLAAIGVLAGALLMPGFRQLAYAPLRELVIPPPRPISVSLLYSTEKEAWLTEAVAAFEATHPMVDGHPVEILMEPMGSREMYLAVLDGTRQPDILSPASSLQIAILQDQSAAVFGVPVVNLADREACRSMVKTPLVLVAWQERAQVLWDVQPGRSLWRDLHDVAVDPQGWASLGHPEWGYFKFGHTDPLRSNSGFMTILLMTYGYRSATSGLTAEDILSDSGYQEWFLEFERAMSSFEYSTGPLMEKMIVYGPSTFDMVAVYEATAIEQAENAIGHYGELYIYYPPATVWSDHPFCILSAEWVSAQKVEAAGLFLDYLASPEVQRRALMAYGFRPVDPSIPLEQAGSPFEVYAENGLRSDLSSLPVVEIPSGGTLNTLLEFWSRNIDR